MQKKSVILKKLIYEYKNCISYNEATNELDITQSFYNLAYMILNKMPNEQIKKTFGNSMLNCDIDTWYKFLEYNFPELIEHWYLVIDQTGNELD